MFHKQYAISDLHIGHYNIIEYCNRPFVDVEEMNETIIENYNKVIKPDDVVYFLGDIHFYKDTDKFKTIFKRLKGQKHLIFGNHDKRYRKSLSELFLSSQDYLEVKLDKQLVVMSHYPFLTWNKGHHGSWMLHGHSHSTLDVVNKESINNGRFRWDVGVDGNNFTPVSFEQLKELFVVCE